MAANRFIPLVSSQSGAVPTASALFPGELALNIADGRLFTRSGSAILLLNDLQIPGGVVSASAQVIGYISGSDIAPAKVTSNEYKLNAGNVSLTFTGSVNTGIFGATEYVMPFIPTSSFCAATVEYVASRPGGVRVGVLLAGWSGSNNTVTDVSSTDIGDTSDIQFSLVQNGGYMKLRVESLGSGSYPWTVQSLFKLFPTLS
jgi:hypothetical protein